MHKRSKLRKSNLKKKKQKLKKRLKKNEKKEIKERNKNVTDNFIKIIEIHMKIILKFKYVFTSKIYSQKK